jgi:GT2 family glycosyltransferase
MESNVPKKKEKFDIKIKNHSVRGLGGKIVRTVKYEGTGALVKKSGIYIARHTIVGKFVPGWAGLHVSPVAVTKWYRKHAKKVTIVIPSYNDIPLLKNCLASIEKTTDASLVNVIVVDDFCEAKNSEKLAKLEKANVKIIYRKENGGFSKAVNSGMKAAKTGDVILLNSDTVVKKGWLEALQYGAHVFDRKAGIVGAKLLYANGTIQFGGSYRNLEFPEWFDHLYRSQPGNFGPANVPQYTIGITGACMYIKRSVITKIGYFDEKFGMAFEDMDYSIRAWNAGFRCLYFPVAAVTHLESATRGKKQGKRELDSQAYFWKKWGKWFDERNVKNAAGQTRIIYVSQSNGVSGGMRMVFEHLNRLSKAGYAIELYSLEKTPDWFPLEVPVITFKNYGALVEALKDEEAIKVATWWETAHPVWLASVTKGIPVYYVQDIETSYYKDEPVMQYTVLSYYKPEFKYFTISGWDQEELRKLGRKSVNVGCGIDSKTFHTLPGVKRQENVLMAVGRKHYLKNLALTLAGWRALPADKQPDLWLFGVEPDIADKEPKMTYHFKPTDEKINELLNQATIFAQTSLHEGFCLTVVEAMAAGLPVITTDSDGNRDFCFHEVNCLMIPQGDAPAMTQAIERLLGDKDLQERLRKGGFKTAAEYDWPQVVERITAFYEKEVVQS